VESRSVAEIVACLEGGGVVLLPTDTVYGLAVKPDFDASVSRLFALKRRPRTVNLPVMVHAESALDALGVEINGKVRNLLRSPLVPGALTLAMGFGPAGPVPAWLAGRDEVAIRIPDHALMLEVLERVGPLLVTSANAHGAETPDRLDEILAQLDGAPDLAVDGGTLRTVPSTLVNCRLEPPVIEREGSIPAARVMEYLS
jgi:L-threonylcarbamoyladenylate synthase